jgi:hypothetical protein
LKKRAAHSHLSMRTESDVIAPLVLHQQVDRAPRHRQGAARRWKISA